MCILGVCGGGSRIPYVFVNDEQREPKPDARERVKEMMEAAEARGNGVILLRYNERIGWHLSRLDELEYERARAA